MTGNPSSPKIVLPASRPSTSPPPRAEHWLPRSGRMPLSFNGRLLAEAAPEQEECRYHVLRVYRTDGGRFILEITYRTNWKREPNYHEVHLIGSPAEAEAALLAYDPTARVQGYPPGSAFAAKQARLLAEIRAAYEQQCSQLLAQAGMREEIP